MGARVQSAVQSVGCVLQPQQHASHWFAAVMETRVAMLMLMLMLMLKPMLLMLMWMLMLVTLMLMLLDQHCCLCVSLLPLRQM
jgi:hypothetical protein